MEKRKSEIIISTISYRQVAGSSSFTYGFRCYKCRKTNCRGCRPKRARCATLSKCGTSKSRPHKIPPKVLEIKYSPPQIFSLHLSIIRNIFAIMMVKERIISIKASGTCNEVSGTCNEVSGTCNEVSETYNEVSETYNEVSETYNEVSGTCNEVSGTCNEVSETCNEVHKLT